MNLHQTPPTRPPLCAITLIDRRPGIPHRAHGAALSPFRRDAAQASRVLLARHQPGLWHSRILPSPGTFPH